MSKARDIADISSGIDIDGAITSDGLTVDTNTLHVDAANNHVGIGTSSPSYKLDVSGSIRSNVSTTGDTNFWATSTGGGLFRIYPDDATVAYPTWTYKTNAFEPHAWQIGSVERLRLDASGNLLSGKTSPSITSVGVEMRGSQGVLTATSQDAPASYFTRMGTAGGPILAFYRDATHAGVIGVGSDADLYIGEDGVGLQFQNTGADRIDPYNVDGQTVRDNAIDLGSSASRFNEIYAGNPTINTSDRNEKQDIDVLSAAEARVAQACKGLLRKFRWKDAVAEKGNDARIHFGIIAQDLRDAFTAESLDAGHYAMFISTTWWETTETFTNDDGVEKTRTAVHYSQADAPAGATERTRLGVRYPELLAFIIGAM
jgi:hypothetical protein